MRDFGSPTPASKPAIASCGITAVAPVKKLKKPTNQDILFKFSWFVQPLVMKTFLFSR